jgi:hypothetical protein
MSNRNKALSLKAVVAQRATAALTGYINWRKWSPARQIDYVFSGVSEAELHASIGANTVLAQLHKSCVANRKGTYQTQARHFLLALAAKRTDLLQRPETIQAVGMLAEHYRHRVRELADWKPKSKNVYAQLKSLVRHLFDQYGDVPAWVINAWDTKHLQRFGVSVPELTLHLGRGKALRHFPGLPVPLTKRLEHEMRQAPAGCTFVEALRYAQLAIRDALAWFGPVLGSRMGREIEPRDDAFWLKVVDFFAAAGMVDAQHFAPVCDWIRQKRSVGIGREPAQPGFSLKGRTMASILAQTEQWHRGLARLRHYGPNISLTTTWVGLPIADFVGGDEGRVRITQLTSYWQLLEEGHAHQHCVASYVQSCLKGRCGIFALTLDGERQLTLEVTRDRILAQARGKYNRSMTADERHWVSHWLGEARLVQSKYV